ncbi:UvrD-helicase domain-containing protein [Salinibacter ruber]|uniref:UvrD-helicase domain-containing protein n=1 Tax=Salinibacter ruber TaxID=146919 RepID=UPI002166F4AE|nr:ATP-dependent helicase [Salinibacter ruber]
MSYTLRPDDWEPQGVEEVESNGWKVIQSTENTSVVAGPGSGKTELLAQRASYLLQTGFCSAPRRILAISFKTDAARNLEERVLSRCDPDLARRFDSYTFDAFNLTTLIRCRKALPDWCQPREDLEPFTRGWKDELRSFLREPPGVEPRSEAYNRLQTIDIEKFYHEYVLDIIPETGFREDTVRKRLAAAWWQELLGGPQSRLTFPMIARLTEFLLRKCPELNNALRSTYSHVFLDEFQDITFWQYDFLETAFKNTDAVLTAVGDHKQSIMGWAGAIPDPFEDFESDFSATTETLISNYRSTPELVGFQHDLARLIDPNTERAESRQDEQVAGDVCRVWRFSSQQHEAEKVAEYIDRKKREQGLTGDQFAVIVKQCSSDFTEDLEPSFENRDLKIRDESQLQDVLSQNLTDLFLKFLRLGSSDSPGAYWIRCCDFMESLTITGTVDDRLESQKVRRELEEFHDDFRGVMRKGVPNTEGDLKEVLRRIIIYVGKGNIQIQFQEYRRDRDFELWYERLVDNMTPILERHTDWNEALDEFEGKDVTPVMTIHKSKGLEYHTVFFLAFEDDTWWTMQANPDSGQFQESLRAFFVGFSRAEQRVIFTNCTARSKCHDVSWMYETLNEAGASFEEPSL